jgi:glutaminyl-tRNA synthetase
MGIVVGGLVAIFVGRDRAMVTNFANNQVVTLPPQAVRYSGDALFPRKRTAVDKSVNAPTMLHDDAMATARMSHGPFVRGAERLGTPVRGILQASHVLGVIAGVLGGIAASFLWRRRRHQPSVAMMMATGASDVKEQEEAKEVTNFLHKIIDEDNASGTYGGKVATRFPPEPNGYLHIGHAKSICLNFRIAEKYGGTCNLRFDDTNPDKETPEFIDAITDDVSWLGYKWNGEVRYASSYFPQLHEYAIQLIKEGKAFVCSLSFEEAREYRGTLTTPGKNSPDRDRPIEENLRLFEEMKAGKHPEGSLTLRLKIDMASPIMNLRDPVIYRIKFAHHHQTGDEWCIYPMYDFTHCISDALEGITHSICTLEFEGNRPLYEYVLDAVGFSQPPKQREFARLNMSNWIMSKRLLTQMVERGLVEGWDDPRLPTLKGLRRRGFTPSSIRTFCDGLGIGKSESVIKIEQLEAALRAELEINAQRRMVVLDPLKVMIDTFPEGEVMQLTQPNHPSDESMGKREILFSREIYIDKADFSLNPPKGYKRLTEKNAIRIRGCYVLKLKEVIYDDNGEVAELVCTHDPETLGKNPVGYKAKGVIHWVSAAVAQSCEVRMYDKLFAAESPGADGRDLEEDLNPNSLVVHSNAMMEKSLQEAEIGQRFQFERQGYFILDSKRDGKPVFNRICALKEGW